MRRRLKIAWTVYFAVLAVALCVLWVRSYWRIDAIDGSWQGRYMYVGTLAGDLYLGASDSMSRSEKRWTASTEPVRRGQISLFVETEGRQILDIAGIRVSDFGGSWRIVMPFWIWTTVLGCLAALPWFRWLPFRFSLRTMLIATTLVAVVLGIIAYSTR